MSDSKPIDKGDSQTGFPFELNGEKLFAATDKMRPLDLLEIAWERKILPFEPDKYRLVSLKDRTVYKPDEYVNLDVDNQFIAEPTMSATVAMETLHVRLPR